MRRGLLGAAEAAVGGVSRAFSHLAALSVAGIVLLLAASSIRRYLLGAPLAVTEELTALLFVSLSFLSLAEGFVARRQIRVLLVWNHLPPKLQGPAILVGQLITLAVLALIIQASFSFALTSYSYGSRSYVSEILLWPWMMLVPFGLGLCFIAVLVRTLVDLRQLRRKQLLPEQLHVDTPERLEP